LAGGAVDTDENWGALVALNLNKNILLFYVQINQKQIFKDNIKEISLVRHTNINVSKQKGNTSTNTILRIDSLKYFQ
jgi:hypothetical protein